MGIDRRAFLHAIAGGAAVALTGTPSLSHAAPQRFKAIAFDAFPIFDPRPVFMLAEALFPGKGADLSNAWRTRQFEYQWLRTLGGHYADFWQATEEALIFAAKMLRLELGADKRDQLMQAYLRLNAWPDAPAALKALKDAGVRLALLSNMTQAMLETNTRHAGLEGLFEHTLSTDQVGSFKPDPKAYALGVRKLGLKREEIVFAAFAGWDVAGAKWYGYPTFWVNRAGSAAEEFGVAADAAGPSLEGLTRFVLGAG